MGISHFEKHLLRAAISQLFNPETALEKVVVIFQRGSTRPVTWNIFISRVEKVDQFTATNMRKKLGIPATPSKHHYIS